MFDNIENLKIISSFRKNNIAGNTIKNRDSHVFFIRIHGSVLYEFSDKSIVTNPGEMIFIPRGSSYTYTRLSDDAMYASINFQCDFIEEPQPVCFPLDNFYETDYISNHFTHMWNLGSQADRYKCISHFYNLLAYISTIENSNYSEKKKIKIIEPAITYLKEHIYDSSLKTDTLNNLCGISNTYFRQIFVSNFGTTPQEYITSKRLSHAKSIIDSGDYDTIGEVALSVGYNDPLYFSKVFKKAYGTCPSSINK